MCSLKEPFLLGELPNFISLEKSFNRKIANPFSFHIHEPITTMVRCFADDVGRFLGRTLATQVLPSTSRMCRNKSTTGGKWILESWRHDTLDMCVVMSTACLWGLFLIDRRTRRIGEIEWMKHSIKKLLKCKKSRVVSPYFASRV